MAKDTVEQLDRGPVVLVLKVVGLIPVVAVGMVVQVVRELEKLVALLMVRQQNRLLWVPEVGGEQIVTLARREVKVEELYVSMRQIR